MFWLGSITWKQVKTLEQQFATLTPQGWSIPEWIQELQFEVILRDYHETN